MAAENKANISSISNKYDRQLRLWGAQGQKALGQTCVVLVRATAAGTETCKNLVLPGCGSLLVIDDDGDADDAVPTVSFPASNFFLTTASDDGNDGDAKPKMKLCRAQMAMESLLELNPDVKGSWIDTSRTERTTLLDFDYAATFAKLTTAAATTGSRGGGGGGDGPIMNNVLVVASDLEPPILHRLSSICWKHQIVLMAVHSYGLIGIVRLQTPPLPIMDPKPRDTVPDLRLVRPFPALAALHQSMVGDYATLENHQHSHIPYPLVLLKISDEWKQQEHRTMDDGNGNNDGTTRGMPGTYEEKQAFALAVRMASRNYDTELNFQEAVRNAYTAYTERSIDRLHLTALSRDVAVATASANVAGKNSCSCSHAAVRCQHLHRLLQALEEFLQRHDGQPPVHGSIPDMTASTDWYVQLQTVYRDQAALDVQEMKQLLLLQTNNEDIIIDGDTIATFCQNVHSIDLLQTGSLADDEEEPSKEICQDLAATTVEGDERPEQLPLLWYLGFRACQLFYSQHGRYPGTTEDYQADVAILHQCIVDCVHRYKLSDNEVLQSTLLQNHHHYAMELTRYGNAEIHTVASVVGGVASQEAVKLITGQYVPINNTYVYNGIASMAAVYKL